MEKPAESEQEEAPSFYEEYVVKNPVARFTKTLTHFKPYTRNALLTMVGLKVAWGYNCGVMAGVMLFAPDVLGLDEVNQEFIMGSANYTAAFSAPALGWMTKTYGCKKSAYISLTFSCAGVVMMTCAWDFWAMLLGRILMGAAYGLSVVTVNSYLVDLSPVKMRGAAGCLAEVGVQVGITIGYLVALVLYFVPHEYNWRLMLGFGVLPSFWLMVQLALLPETPRWLVSQDRVQEARQVLLDTLDEDEVEPSIQRAEAVRPLCSRMTPSISSP
jgi:MFS family permease